MTGFQVGESGGGAGVCVVLMRDQQCLSGCYTQERNGNTCISYPFVCCFHTLGREIFNAVGVTPKGWGRRGKEGGSEVRKDEDWISHLIEVDGHFGLRVHRSSITSSSFASQESAQQISNSLRLNVWTVIYFLFLFSFNLPLLSFTPGSDAPYASFPCPRSYCI